MRILIVDDEHNINITLKNILEDDGYQCQTASNMKEAIEEIERFSPDVVMLDVRLGSDYGIDVLQKIKEIDSNIQTIMISGNSNISEAVKAIKLGAFDFLEKPLSLPKVKIAVSKAIQFRKMSEEYHHFKQTYKDNNNIIGSSKAIEQVKNMISKVAPTNAKVLIRGESGSGKELIAYAIHNQSTRAENSFVKFNSAAIPNELVESELFGYEKGAFTGANKTKKGKLELADGGTIFLDEIGDMSLSAQAKILRVIQEGEFERVGANNTIKIDVRIIAATHKNLESMVEDGTFRKDLFYRLNVVPIHSPALRERSEDIPELIEYFSKLFSIEMKIKQKTFTDKALKLIQTWDFPGNIRELRNIIERLYILVDSNEITDKDLSIINSFEEKKEADFWRETKPFAEKKKEFEIRYLSTQYKIFGFNVSKTAEHLGFQQGNLSRKLKELNISKEDK